MRIALVSNNYTPYSGGVVSALNVLASSLINQGHSVCLIVPDFGKVASKDDPDYVLRLDCFAQFSYKKKPIALSFAYRRDVLHLIHSFSPDIIHVHHPFLLGVAGRNAARKLRKPVIFTYHTCYEEYSHYVPLLGITSQYIISYLVTSFCNSVDGIIAPSSTIADRLTKKNKKIPIKKIPTAINDLFLANKFSMVKRTKDDPFSLLYVGRFVKEKNVELLLRVLNQLDKRFSLKLVGYGSLYKKLQHLAYEVFSFASDRVQFFHSPSISKIARLYSDSDLFLFPSLYDTQGLVLAEAMASGTPVIALDGPGQRDIIDNGFNGYIVASEKEMIKKVKRVADDSLLHATLQKGAYRTSKKYQSEKYIDNTIAFYKKIMRQTSH